ncbi:MAG TPA: carboxypeptidase-like regulatory domain-containing protein, partial [Acidobacteriaceae bacterium]
MKKLLTLFLLVALRATAQVNYGELRLRIADPSGAGIQASVELSCAGDGYDETFTSDSSGTLAVQTMPYGVYQIQVKKPGFAPYTTSVELRSALPVTENIQLTLASVLTNVTVEDRTTLIDPYNPSSVMQIGAKQMQERLSSLPGRSVQDLVNGQPGWLYEGNAVLHPRGSEYQ